MRSPRATSVGPVAAGATEPIKLGSTIDGSIPLTGSAAQQIGRPRLTLAGDAADRAARALAERRAAAAVTVMAWPTLPAAPPSTTPAEAKPLSEATLPAEAQPPRLVHQPADPETIAWNQARMAEWQAGEAEAKARAKAEMNALVARLRDLAPLVFGADVVPLKIGIHRDIPVRLVGEADKATIGRFLRRWTRRTDYLRAIAAGNMRRDLRNNPTGEPTLGQRAEAARLPASRETT